LLTEYHSRSPECRATLRSELGLTTGDIAADFACAVLLSDGFLRLRLQDTDSARFWMIMIKLPMELQMILCHRSRQSPRQTVLVRDTEVALKAVIRDFPSLPFVVQ